MGLTSYKELFSFAIYHNFFKDGIANEFIFVPLEDTVRDMKRFRLTFRPNVAIPGEPQTNGFKVLYQEVNGAPLIPITADNYPAMRFAVIPHGGLIKSVTDLEGASLDGDIGNGYVQYIHNEGSAPTLWPNGFSLGAEFKVADNSLLQISTSQRARLKNEVFKVPFELDAGTVFSNEVSLEVRRRTGGAQLADFAKDVEVDAVQSEMLVDLTKSDVNFHRLRLSYDHDKDGGTAVERADFLDNEEVTNSGFARYYCDDEAIRLKPMFILDLTVDDVEKFAAPTAFRLIRNQRFWTYYIVNKSASLTGALSIDKNASGTAHATYAEWDVSGEANEEEERAARKKEFLEAQHPDATVTLFRSSLEIPSFEGWEEYNSSASRGMFGTYALKHNGSDIIINKLPAPDFFNAEADSIIII